MITSIYKIYILLLAVCLAGFLWISYVFFNSPITSSIHPCFIKSLTQIPCPSCGSTRSVMAILSGQFQSAFYWNPLGYLILAGLVIMPIWIIVDMIFGIQSFYNFYCFLNAKIQSKKIAFPLMLLLLMNWYWNIKKGL